MDILDILADREIEKANAEGKLDDLPGKGKPLKLDEDNPHVSREMRAVYRFFKQAGILPVWVQLAKDLAEIDREIVKLEETLVRAHAQWSDELVMIPSAELSARARQWHTDERMAFVELVARRARLFQSYDAAAPRNADRSMAMDAKERVRRFDKVFPKLVS
jgi:hypothetical protein